MNNTPMSKDTNKRPNYPISYPLRLEPSLREELETKAKKKGRSLNTEIIAMLKKGLQASKSLSNKQFLADIDLKKPENLTILRSVVREVIEEDKRKKEK